MKFIVTGLAVLAALALIGWLGVNIQPASFEPFSQSTPSLETVALPDDLPVPVERFYRQLYGDRIPVIESAVISGRAKMRPVGPIALPARFRFTHQAGEGYRHYIETTFFGIPIMRVNERYLDGKGLMELPFGTFEGEKINQGANLGLWGEAMYYPAILLTDPRVRWEALDENTALLIVPFGDRDETFVIRFNPESGMIDVIEAMRYKGEDSLSKTLWIPKVLEWAPVSGQPTMAKASITWMDDGSPWVVFEVEEIVLNANVQEYIRAHGK